MYPSFHLTSWLLLAFFLLTAFAAPSPPPTPPGDVLTLYNGQRFIGKVRKVNDCVVTFRAEDGKKYFIPVQDIASLDFATDSRAARQYRNGAINPCLQARADVDAFYQASIGYFFAGLFLGVVGIVIAAVSSPMPYDSKETMTGTDPTLFEDPMYLNCYEKKARTKNVMFALWGILASFGAALIIGFISAMLSV